MLAEMMSVNLFAHSEDQPFTFVKSETITVPIKDILLIVDHDRQDNEDIWVITEDQYEDFFGDQIDVEADEEHGDTPIVNVSHVRHHTKRAIRQPVFFKDCYM